MANISQTSALHLDLSSSGHWPAIPSKPLNRLSKRSRARNFNQNQNIGSVIIVQKWVLFSSNLARCLCIIKAIGSVITVLSWFLLAYGVHIHLQTLENYYYFSVTDKDISINCRIIHMPCYEGITKMKNKMNYFKKNRSPVTN
jgi:hypothetical protein